MADTKAPRRTRAAAKATGIAPVRGNAKRTPRQKLTEAVEAVRADVAPASRAALADRAPAQYTAQLVHLDTPDTEARVLAHLAHQRKSAPGRTKSMVLRDVVAAGLAALEGGITGEPGIADWISMYGALPKGALAAARRTRDAKKDAAALARAERQDA